MAKAATADTEFHRHDKVVANVDLAGMPAGVPHTPAGTPGKVTVVDGFTWTRYRVLFENGVDRGFLDGGDLVRPKDFIPVDQRVAVEAEAPSAASDDGDAGGDAGSGDDGGSRGGVPAHLLERSKKARERLAAAG
jgi:hypothetical protein